MKESYHNSPFKEKLIRTFPPRFWAPGQPYPGKPITVDPHQTLHRAVEAAERSQREQARRAA